MQNWNKKNYRYLGIVLLVVIILGITYLALNNFSKQNEAAANLPPGVIKGNIKSLADAKVESINDLKMDINTGTEKFEVVLDKNTQVIESKTIDKATALKPGNTISVNFTVNSAKVKVANLIILQDASKLAAANVSGTPSTGPIQPKNTTSYLGTVNSVVNSTLKLKAAEEIVSFDVAAATYKISAIRKTSEIKVGDTVRVFGVLQQNGQISARGITLL